MLYALLGIVVIVVVLAASAMSLFLGRRDGSPRDPFPEFPDAEGSAR
jgi:hypothetical protein